GKGNNYSSEYAVWINELEEVVTRNVIEGLIQARIIQFDSHLPVRRAVFIARDADVPDAANERHAAVSHVETLDELVLPINNAVAVHIEVFLDDDFLAGGNVGDGQDNLADEVVRDGGRGDVEGWRAGMDRGEGGPATGHKNESTIMAL